MAKLLQERKQGERAVRVAITSFTITNDAFVDAICGKIGRSTESVSVYTQNELPAYGTEKLKRCAEDAGISDVHTALRGLEGDFGSFHPKLVLLDFEDGSTDLYLSSGNPTTGSELYFDHNVVLSASTKSPFVGWHKCVVSLFKEGTYSPSYSAMRQRYRTCENREPR